jgi:uncharacterized protein with PIN domain
MPYTTEPTNSDEDCPKCKNKGITTKMTYRVWESSDKAFEDFMYACPVCAYYYWIDGADA